MPLPPQRHVTPSANAASRHLPCIVKSLLGVWLLIGAFVTVTRGHWPAFMPPLLDVIVLPLMWLSQWLGIVTGAGLSAASGIALLAVRCPAGTGSTGATS